MDLSIGQFSESFPPIMDGVGNVVKNYAYWLNKRYGNCYVITPRFPKYTDNEEFQVLRYGSLSVPTRHPYRTGLPKLCASFMKKLKSTHFDLVHAHTPFSSGNIALDTAKRLGIPIVASFHSKYYDDLLRSFKLEGVAKFGVSKIIEFYNSVDAVWTVNNSTAYTLREYGFKGTIDIVPNGTEYEPAGDKIAERTKVNEKLGINKDELIFIYVGQMVWQKNIKVLIEALSLLKKSGLKFTMLMVGQGYALDDLKDMSVKLDIEDTIKFIGPIYDRDYLKSLYCRADLLVFPSLYDNASIVLREAASQSCPALLIEGSNTAEGVTHLYNGFLSENSADDIAQSILKITDTQKLLEVGKNAKETIYTNWDSIVNQVYGRYCEIIKFKRKLMAWH